MTWQPRQPQGMRVAALRLYYDGISGDVVHIHRLVSPPGERLDEQSVDREVAAFAASLRQRHSRDLEVLEVDRDELDQLLAGGGRLTVDPQGRRLTTDS